MRDLRATYGQYAVVTGASSGIGEEFARQAAQSGMNTILVARRADRLESLAHELSETYGTVNVAVPLDLLRDDAVEVLWESISDRDIGMIVINAGFSLAGDLVEHSLADEADMLTIHTTVPLRLAHRFGSHMAERKRGAIVMVSSSIAAGQGEGHRLRQARGWSQDGACTGRAHSSERSRLTRPRHSRVHQRGSRSHGQISSAAMADDAPLRLDDLARSHLITRH